MAAFQFHILPTNPQLVQKPDRGGDAADTLHLHLFQPSVQSVRPGAEPDVSGIDHSEAPERLLAVDIVSDLLRQIGVKNRPVHNPAAHIRQALCADDHIAAKQGFPGLLGQRHFRSRPHADQPHPLLFLSEKSPAHPGDGLLQTHRFYAGFLRMGFRWMGFFQPRFFWTYFLQGMCPPLRFLGPSDHHQARARAGSCPHLLGKAAFPSRFLGDHPDGVHLLQQT